ncbi:LCP family protein [Frigoribacterium sp. VKM Ac-1396]|uniref:LCP family protein n=1 Tax=Frigoribacterium sp. VKM Ac-1396 TaxID=2783821 RepID=UPI00188C4672|nr:LCP family protein [Frigoribacterium sp. VKM Ac-1396]MBF4601655.1 LCP family protein [Frigoribacterium sp. VKM Ac-1396]
MPAERHQSTPASSEADALDRLGLEGAEATTPPPPRGERSARRRDRRRRRRVVATLVSALVVFVGLPALVLGVGAGYLAHLARTWDEGATTIEAAFPDEADRPAPADDGSLDVLLLGSDTRVAGESGRSDSMMLVHLPADRSAVYVMSIMRDTWVDVPGHGMAKINAAYSWGGVPLTVQTVEQLLQTRVDHVAEVDFAGFEAMTDALGGVDVVSERAFRAGGHEFVQGENHLDGEQALDFVRERKSFAEADHQRVRNQQAFVRGLVDGLLDRHTLTDPAALSAFVAATADHVAVDPGLTPTRMAEVAWSSRGLRPSGLKTFTMATSGGGTSADGQSYVSFDVDRLYALREALRDDTVGGYLAGASSASPAG